EGGRALEILDETTRIADRTARSRLHLHPGAQVTDGLRDDGRTAVIHTPAGLVRITARHPMRLEPAPCSRQFGLVEPTTSPAQDRRADAPAPAGGGFRIEPIAGSPCRPPPLRRAGASPTGRTASTPISSAAIRWLASSDSSRTTCIPALAS